MGENLRSKQLVSIVEVLSEGEIGGLVNGHHSIYLDNTPIRGITRGKNFENITVDQRTGRPHQSVMAQFGRTEKEISVGTELKHGIPLTRTITDPKVNRVRLTLGVSALFKQEEDGSNSPQSVDFKITVGDRVEYLTITGKHTAQYLRNLTLSYLPSVPFSIKVERVQENSDSLRLQNNTLWSAYTEITDTAFTYPHTALIGIKFDSRYFANIPTRTYDVLGIKVKVPSNYDPIRRTYTGLWDGTFKIAWTNNPAWILYDLVTSKRYGLGQRLGEFGADKWALYQVAQYCDQLIPNGFGGKEPRFTCNVWLTEQRSAYDVINDICSIFRAMPVWNGTELTVIMDRPADPVWTYTAANVIGGFSRQYSAMKARHNAVQVEYLDADNNYEKAIEYVSDDEAIRKYGLNLKKVTAFGCTSRGQAHRTGLWILMTEKLETETITFTVGSEGLMHIPGDIIRVADTQYAGANIGGRVLAMNGRILTLDREVSETEFNLVKLTFTVPFSTVKGYILIGFRNKTLDNWVEFHSLKLEKGTIATDWTPAPEDTDTALTGIRAEISSTSRTVADLSNKVSSTHTIKAQAIAGGRTAIAGIALGATADNRTAESSVIVMADRFGVVKNAQDGTVKPMFNVVNNKVAIHGDLVADGSITATKLAANSVTTGALQAGVVRTEHLAAGQVSADKLAIGLGGNIIYNPLLSNEAYGWRDFNTRGGDWNGGGTSHSQHRTYSSSNTFHPKGLENECWRVQAITGTEAQFNTMAAKKPWVDCIRISVNVVKDRWYIFSAYIGCFHCGGQLLAEKYSADGHRYQRLITSSPIYCQEDIERHGNEPIEIAHSGHFENGVGAGTKRGFVKFRAPDTGKVMLIFRINRYARNNTYADAYFARPMLEECTEHTREPSPWQNAGVTAIHGGSIVTNSITAQQIGAGAITANHLTAGAIATRHISANSINASQHIQARSIGADKLSIQSLSAVSANLGTVTSGRIESVNIHGNTITGGTISGTEISATNIKGGTISGTTVSASTIDGGTIKGVYIESAHGRFTGTLEVNQLIGSNILEVTQLQVNVKQETRRQGGENQRYWVYHRTIHVAASSVERLFMVLNSNIYQVIPAHQSRTIEYRIATESTPFSVLSSAQGNFITVMMIALTSAKTIS